MLWYTYQSISQSASLKHTPRASEKSGAAQGKIKVLTDFILSSID